MYNNLSIQEELQLLKEGYSIKSSNESVKDILRLIREGHQYTENGIILTEAYYGKNPKLLECEKLLEKAMKSKVGTKEIKQVEQILQELFNFKKLILAKVPFVLAGTSPITAYKFRYMTKTIEMERTPYGLQFKKEANVEAVIFIDLNLMVAIGLTPSEVLAVILHEIGHSMRTLLPSNQIHTVSGALGFLARLVPSITFEIFGSVSMKVSDFMYKIVDIIREKIRYNKRETQAYWRKVILRYLNILGSIGSLVSITEMFKRNKGNILSVIKDIFNLPANRKNIMHNILLLPSSYKEEIFSDYVATAYGYGPELTSFFHKYDKFNHEEISNNAFTRLLLLPFSLTRIALDPHPTFLTRALLVINNLENELKKDINKEAYDEIKKDLDIARENLEIYKKQFENFGIKNIDRKILKKVTSVVMDEYDDIKYLLFGLKPEDIKELDDFEDRK